MVNTRDKLIAELEKPGEQSFTYSCNGIEVWKCNLTSPTRYVRIYGSLSRSLASGYETPQHANVLTLLDVGCSTGEAAKNLQDRLTSAGYRIRLMGVDTAAEAVERAAMLNDFDYAVVGCGQRLPLKDSSVDIALAVNFLHRLDPKQQAQGMQEIRRVLKKDGVAVCTIRPYGEPHPWMNAVLTAERLDSLAEQSDGFTGLLYADIIRHRSE